MARGAASPGRRRRGPERDGSAGPSPGAAHPAGCGCRQCCSCWLCCIRASPATPRTHQQSGSEESEGEGKEFDDWEEDYDSPEEEPLSAEGYRVSAALEEAAKMFLRTSRAREAALDGGLQMHS
ncbi:hypothetical protein ABFV05_007564 [Capra hircus]